MLGYALLFPAAVGAAALSSRAALPIDSCPGYKATNVQDHGVSLTADLHLAGSACNTFGDDLATLKLKVDYETGKFRPLAQSICSSDNLTNIDHPNRYPAPCYDLRRG
jgi:hypothetical protein